ncbi:MAG: leucine-rich repeat protein [Acutalibacteraceae bacterium]|nr:leucine-rich repeat protein [Acutalibacteraceae bacterium]
MRKFLSIVLSAIMLCSMSAGFSVMAGATEESSVNSEDTVKTSGNYEYRLLDDGTAEITKYIGNETNITIPSSIDGYKVTSLGYASFQTSNPVSVTIPDTVTTIGYIAFKYCTNLIDIKLPDSITTILDDAFEGTGYLSDESNWEDGMLYIGNYLVEVNPNISGDCKIKEGTIMISASIPKIYDIYIPDIKEAVYDIKDVNSLTSITIPSSVKYIAEDSFILCSEVGKINVENNKYYHLVDGVLFETNSNTLIKYPSLTYNSSYTIPNGTTSIGDYAFIYSDVLTSIDIPNSVKSIGKDAFSWCEGLTSIAIPESVTSIDNGAFSSCINLVDVNIPKSVTSISDYTFSDCYSLKSITIPENVTSIGNLAFRGCNSLKNITIPENVTSIGQRAFSSCYFLTDITIPKNVTSVGEDAFNLCENLKKVTVMNPECDVDLFHETRDIADTRLYIKMYRFENSTGEKYIEYYGVKIMPLIIISIIVVVAVVIIVLLLVIKKRNNKKLNKNQ